MTSVARLYALSLKHYRSFSDVKVIFQSPALLIGANNSGKTSILEAIDKVFGAGRRAIGLDEDDLPAGQPDDRLRLEFDIRPTTAGVFTDAEHGLFESHIDFLEDDSEVVLIRIEGYVDQDGLFRVSSRFLKLDGEDDGVFDRATREKIDFFYLPSVRDVRRELEERAGLWSRLVGLLEGAQDPERLRQLAQETGRELAAAVLGTERIEAAANLISHYINVTLFGGDAEVTAELSALPLDYRQLLRHVSIMITTPHDHAPVPIERMSTGMQALGLFALFRAYLETQGGIVLGIGFEEPENHLSPHAARTLVKTAVASDVQVFITTHSPVVSSLLNPGNAILLRRNLLGSSAHFLNLDALTPEELMHISRSIRSASGGDFLFARSVILVEGQSEEGAFPEFARHVNIDLDKQGVSVVGVGGATFRPYLRLLAPDALNIPYVIVCDNDSTLTRLLSILRELRILPEEIDIEEPDRRALQALGVYWWQEGDFEQFLVAHNGFPAFEAAADFLYGESAIERVRTRRRSQDLPDDDESVIMGFVRRREIRKPELALETARRFAQLSIPTPRKIVRILNAAVAMGKQQPVGGDEEPA
jgi:putative ATP-dependent endonuclease of OLD family